MWLCVQLRKLDELPAHLAVAVAVAVLQAAR